MQWFEILGISATVLRLVSAFATGLAKYHFDRKLESLKQENQRQLEKYKQKAAASQQRAIERLKATLGKESTEHGIKFGKLYETIADVTLHLFQKLERSHNEIEKYYLEREWQNEQDQGENHKPSWKETSELTDYVRRNSLFITDPINKVVADYISWTQMMEYALRRTPRTDTSIEKLDADLGQLGARFTGVRRELQRLIGLAELDESTTF